MKMTRNDVEAIIGGIDFDLRYSFNDEKLKEKREDAAKETIKLLDEVMLEEINPDLLEHLQKKKKKVEKILQK